MPAAHCPRTRHSPGRDSGLLGQFSSRRGLEGFARAIAGAGGEFPQRATGRMPPLPDQDDAVGCIDRHDRYRARMLDHLAVGLAPVRKPDGIVEDAYQPPFVDRSPADGRLAQMRIEVEAHIASLPQARPTGEFPSASGA